MSDIPGKCSKGYESTDGSCSLRDYSGHENCPHDHSCAMWREVTDA